MRHYHLIVLGLLLVPGCGSSGKIDWDDVPVGMKGGIELQCLSVVDLSKSLTSCTPDTGEWGGACRCLDFPINSPAPDAYGNSTGFAFNSARCATVVSQACTPRWIVVTNSLGEEELRAVAPLVENSYEFTPFDTFPAFLGNGVLGGPHLGAGPIENPEPRMDSIKKTCSESTWTAVALSLGYQEDTFDLEQAIFYLGLVYSPHTSYLDNWQVNEIIFRDQPPGFGLPSQGTQGLRPRPTNCQNGVPTPLIKAFERGVLVNVVEDAFGDPCPGGNCSVATYPRPLGGRARIDPARSNVFIQITSPDGTLEAATQITGDMIAVQEDCDQSENCSVRVPYLMLGLESFDLGGDHVELARIMNNGQAEGFSNSTILSLENFQGTAEIRLADGRRDRIEFTENSVFTGFWEPELNNITMGFSLQGQLGDDVTVRLDGNIGGSFENLTPRSIAGLPQTVECASPVGTTVVLDGTASFDYDGDAISYQWMVPGPGVLLPSDPFAFTATTVSPLLARGTSAFILQVQDTSSWGSYSRTVATVVDTEPPETVDISSPWACIPPGARGGHGYQYVRLDLGAELLVGSTDRCEGDVSASARIVDVDAAFLPPKSKPAFFFTETAACLRVTGPPGPFDITVETSDSLGNTRLDVHTIEVSPGCATNIPTEQYVDDCTGGTP